MQPAKPSRIRAALQRILRFLRRQPGVRKEPDNPQDPYAYVGAPKRPRTPNRSAAAVAELPEE
ncbi:MAG: hypothetical protein LAO20_06730 [Acidobacteriia bacterium]|nr:hypothetical protein [Terriglobia bacterium]